MDTKKVYHTDRLKKLLYYLGNGDPNSAKVWFFGIEEAYVYKQLDEIDKIPEVHGTYEGHQGPHTPVYDIISKIIIGLNGRDWQKEWLEYRNHKLFSKGSEAFQGNLYPLGKRHVACWPEEYSEWFGLTKDEYYKLISNEKTGRFNYLHEKRNEYGNPLTFCFGKAFWNDFIKCFCLVNSSVTEYQKLFKFYVKEKIVLTPFFLVGGRLGMNNERIGKLLNLVNESGMNPFSYM